MDYVKLQGKGKQIVHVQQKHSSYTLCGEVKRSQTRKVDGPANCTWCVDSLDDMIDAIVVENGGKSLFPPEEATVA
jgi:uncharacterized protein YunC (DUF1805 family)